jgi:hypothetical protein
LKCSSFTEHHILWTEFNELLVVFYQKKKKKKKKKKLKVKAPFGTIDRDLSNGSHFVWG